MRGQSENEAMLAGMGVFGEETMDVAEIMSLEGQFRQVCGYPSFYTRDTA